MKPSIELDLGDMVDILEGFTKKLENMPLKDKIDLAARLKPVAKHCETIDKAVKTEVKGKLKHAEGVLKGDLFKATLTLVPIDRFEQKKLKEEKPTIYNQFVRNDVDERVSFELR